MLRRRIIQRTLAIAAALGLIAVVYQRIEREAMAARLYAAAERGDASGLVSLLREGVSVDARHDGATPLMIAALYGRDTCVDALLAHGSQVDAVTSGGQTALMWATGAGELESVRLLLLHHADPRHRDAAGLTPLCEAATNGSEDVAALLIDSGAEVRGEDGRRALLNASAQGNTGVVRLLLDAGAPVNPADGQRTPLMSAARNGNTEIVRLLIEAGARVEARDSSGRTALSWAQRRNQELARLLDRHSNQAKGWKIGDRGHFSAGRGLGARRNSPE